MHRTLNIYSQTGRYFWGGADVANTFHRSPAMKYPKARLLPLPNSAEIIASSEMARFSPQRLRDINGLLIAGEISRSYSDARVRSYDCSGSVSLSAHMQSNVPMPCPIEEHYSHFNMPGGLWCQSDKYLAEDHLISKANSTFLRHYSQLTNSMLGTQQFRLYSQQVPEKTDGLTRAQKLKTAVKEYGSVVVVFHVGISLLSLGVCYLIVTSGIDFSSMLSSWSQVEGGAAAAGAAPFVVAYAIHKVFAPARISITLISVPFIVRYLRRSGFLKPKPTK